jgi:DNA repair protein RAD5
MLTGYMLFKSSSLCSLKLDEQVTLSRSIQPQPQPQTQSKKSSIKLDTIVRFKNSNNLEVGRISELDAQWISKLMDLNICSFKGSTIQVPKNFHSG